VSELPLPALEGTNPLGFMAALGVLDAASAATPGVTLSWTDELVPRAALGGFNGGLDDLLDLLDQDREQWQSSPMLAFPDDRPVLTDAKPDKETLRNWFAFVSGSRGSADAAAHLCSIVAEEAFDGGGKAKPTHLHFTAGQQQWLRMVRELVYALRGFNPSGQKRLGVPGADWLAFRGLAFYPVARTDRGALRTTACDPEWKSSAFRWPLWKVPITRNVVRSLVADATLVGKDARLHADALAARGIISVRESLIRRTDQGGYGSFAASIALADAPSR
jgi:hypothetical protein